MALAVNGSGTIFKKCDRSSHRPASNKGCASSTCQHTCDSPERCPHAWTLRYRVNGKQVEKSFEDKQHPATGRVDYGGGRKLARDWQLKVTVDKRSGDVAFADHSKSGKQDFGEACKLFIARLPVTDGSKSHYRSVYRKHVKPVFGDMTLSQVANDRDGVMDLLAVKMRHLSNTPSGDGKGREPLKHRKADEYRSFLAVGDGSGHARWAADPWEREAVPTVRDGLLPVHERCPSGRHP